MSNPETRASLVAVLVLAAVVGGALALTHGDGTDADPSASPATSTPDAPAPGATDTDYLAGTAVQGLEQAWQRHDRAAFARAAGDSDAAKAWAGRTYDNLAALGATGVRLRYVGPDTQAPTDHGFAADVEVSWRPGSRSGLSPTQTAEQSVTFTFATAGNRVDVVDSGAVGDRFAPVWLLGPVTVTVADGATVISIGSSGLADRVVAMTATALHQVGTVVADADDSFVVVVPDDVDHMGEMVGSKPAQLGQIAAVTTTVDGSSNGRAPVHIVVNPTVFGGLGRNGAQVVLTHEAVHATTDATTVTMPLWVAEGFADYVALAAQPVPLQTSAGQILDYVDTSGAPRHIPANGDFGAREATLGRTYEAAWLIWRMLGERYANERVVGFYDDVRTGSRADAALRRDLGLTMVQLTADWRAYLTRLAG